MKLPVLVLLGLLGLTSASPQEEIAVKNPQLTIVTLSKEEQKKQLFGDNVNLEWVRWDGSLPNGAVSLYNSYEKRTDYVCKFICVAGFYSPSLGQYCHVPFAGKEIKVPRYFDILTNKDNFEFLEWQYNSFGSVPEHGIRTCPGLDIYVGKNKYGLGKVHPDHKCIYVPWHGDEYWYNFYDVLAINREDYSQQITDVRYGINEAKILQHAPETMRMSGVTNNECQSVVKTVSMSKTTDIQATWNIDRTTFLSAKSSITAEIPLVGSAGIELTGERTLQVSTGKTIVESISHSVSIELTIPPNHYCRVRMEGRKVKAYLNYTARLSRTYRNGETQTTSISGTYEGVQIGEVRAVVDRCEPVVDAKPCP